METNYLTVNSPKDQAIINAIFLAFEKNHGVEGLFEYHVRDFISILYYHNVQDSDIVRYYLTEALWNDDGTTDELINETVSVFVENEYEAGMEAYNDYDDHGDHDGYFEKQYYQNPAGRCEDAPCCGCCGYM